MSGYERKNDMFEVVMDTFDCGCGHCFDHPLDDCERDLHCSSGDDMCSCGGVTYYAECPKCGNEAECFRD